MDLCHKSDDMFFIMCHINIKNSKVNFRTTIICMAYSLFSRSNSSDDSNIYHLKFNYLLIPKVLGKNI